MGQIKRNLIAAFAFITVVGQPAFAWDAAVSKVKTARYSVLALDGSWHDLEIQYNAKLEYTVWQSGHSAKVKLSGTSLRDTRQCHFDTRRNISKSFSRSVNQGTNEEDVLYRPLSNEIFKYSAEQSEIADKYFETLFYGGLYDFGDTTVNLVDSSIDGFKDFFDSKKPFGFAHDMLNAAFEFGTGSLGLLGNSVGRTLGLRTGTNCGEAAVIIDASKAYQKGVFEIKAKIKFALDPYLSVPDLIRDWKYRAPNGDWVGAVFVLPSSIDIGSDVILASQYLVLIDLISDGDYPPELVAELLDTPISKDAPKIISAKVLEHEIDQLLDTSSHALSEAKTLSRELGQLIQITNPFRTSLESNGASDDMKNELIGLISISKQKHLPACLVVPGGDKAHFMLTLAPQQSDVAAIRAGSMRLSQLTTELAKEVDRLVGFSGLVGGMEDPVYARLINLQGELVSVLAPNQIIFEFDAQARRCANSVILYQHQDLRDIVPPSWTDKLQLKGGGPKFTPRLPAPTSVLVDTGPEFLDLQGKLEISQELSDALGSFD